MPRIAISIFSFLAILTGCAGPIETRIETSTASAIPSAKQFMFTEKPEQTNELYQTARTMVAKKLSDMGFAQANAAPILIHLSLADRPASIALSTGEKEKTRPLASAKKRKPLQSCQDQEHRLTVNLINQSSGSIIYSGTASEYHCNGLLSASLPHLVNAALSDLSSAEIGGSRNVTRTRAGVD